MNDKFEEGKEVSVPQILSIMGWQLQQQTDKPTLECLFCGRCVPIDKFVTGEHPRQKIINERIIKETEKVFEPIE
jgi:hypothetical protein